jgi:G:T/U-mismatch repair DNA glycosylase
MLRDGLDIVFCGTAAGKSNSFWKVLMQVGLTKEEILTL